MHLTRHIIYTYSYEEPPTTPSFYPACITLGEFWLDGLHPVSGCTVLACKELLIVHSTPDGNYECSCMDDPRSSYACIVLRSSGEDWICCWVADAWTTINVVHTVPAHCGAELFGVVHACIQAVHLSMHVEFRIGSVCR